MGSLCGVDRYIDSTWIEWFVQGGRFAQTVAVPRPALEGGAEQAFAPAVLNLLAMLQGTNLIFLRHLFRARGVQICCVHKFTILSIPVTLYKGAICSELPSNICTSISLNKR